MNTNLPPSSERPAWNAELSLLFLQPLDPSEDIHREGELIGLRISPQRNGDTTVDLLISLFLLALPPVNANEAEAHHIALEDYVNDLQDGDYHIRMAACRGLGQLGDPAGSSALQRSERAHPTAIVCCYGKYSSQVRQCRFRLNDRRPMN